MKHNQLDSGTAVVVDQHPLWLDAIGKVLDGLGVQVVGATTSTEEALRLVRETSPKLLVVGHDGPGNGTEMDSLTCLRLARREHPDLRAVVLSAYREPERVDAAFEAGAVAYVVKTAQAEDVASAVRQAFSHSVYLAGALRPQPVPAPKREEVSVGMTRRELEILRLVSEGHSNAELARMLWVTEQTIKFHLSNIYRKLDVSNRTEASRWARVHGLLTERVPQLSVA